MTSSLAIVTRAGYPHADVDQPALLTALAARDVRADVVDWQDCDVEWAGYDAAVIRSTWNYQADPRAFLAWAASVDGQTTLLNPARVVAWNADKRYLGQLSSRGVPVVPTTYVEPGQGWRPPDYAEYVLKPVVSADADGSGRFRRGVDDAAAAALAARVLSPGREVMGRRLAEAHALMVQPYLRSVETDGEVSLMYFDGEYSHAMRKGALLAAGGGLLRTGAYWDNVVATETTAEERAVAQAALAVVPTAEPLAYARVDLVRDDRGRPVVLELELIEPTLCLYADEQATDRFADVLAARVRPIG